MPTSVDDLGQIQHTSPAYSDRIQRGTKEDRPPRSWSADHGRPGPGDGKPRSPGADVLDTEVREALAAGARFGLILGAQASAWAICAQVVRSVGSPASPRSAPMA